MCQEDLLMQPLVPFVEQGQLGTHEIPANLDSRATTPGYASHNQHSRLVMHQYIYIVEITFSCP
jgi:hypothetical protein